MKMVINTLAQAYDLCEYVWAGGLAQAEMVTIEVNPNTHIRNKVAEAMGLAYWVPGLWVGHNYTGRVIVLYSELSEPLSSGDDKLILLTTQRGL